MVDHNELVARLRALSDHTINMRVADRISHDETTDFVRFLCNAAIRALKEPT